MSLPHPPPLPAPPPLGWIGDIAVTADHVVTPTGTVPLRGSTWTVVDGTRRSETISTTGIVLCIVFVWFCLLGLLFLLMKEQRTDGFVQVTVMNQGWSHTTWVPATGPQTYSQVVAQVSWARQMSL